MPSSRVRKTTRRPERIGGVWVAHPDVREPERVIIRNPSNGKFVIGALFRKERATPGPELQVSSDAADALGLVAGQPTNLNVTALRREKTPETPQVPETLDPAGLDAPEAITASELDAPAASAAAAIAAAPATPPRPKPAPQAASLDKPYIQLGIFSIEKNAENTAAAMKSRGLNAIIKKQSSQGKTFWRVLVGPAASAAELGVQQRHAGRLQPACRGPDELDHVPDHLLACLRAVGQPRG